LFDHGLPTTTTGTTLVDGLRLFFNDPITRGIIVIGEIGGRAEFDAAELIEEYLKTEPNPKPIIAMVTGRTAPKGRTMGHAGALISPEDMGAEAKIQALARAGAVIVPHPGMMGSEMRRLLSG
jgi:succinyl-CoA synthetase alpha subunit